MYVVVDLKNDTIAGGNIKTDDIVCFPVFPSEEEARLWIDMELAEYDASSIGANPNDFVVVPARIEAGGLEFSGTNHDQLKKADKSLPN